jgi:hypothetical protein
VSTTTSMSTRVSSSMRWRPKHPGPAIAMRMVEVIEGEKSVAVWCVGAGGIGSERVNELEELTWRR